MKYLLTKAAYFIFYALLLFGIVQGGKAAYRFGYEVFGTVTVQKAPGENVSFMVRKEDTMSSVARHLEDSGLILDRRSFLARTRLMDPRMIELRPGYYVLNTSMQYDEIINQLTVSEGIDSRHDHR